MDLHIVLLSIAWVFFLPQYIYILLACIFLIKKSNYLNVCFSDLKGRVIKILEGENNDAGR